MKQAIHPQWYSQAKVLCICGNTFTVGATKSELKVDICSHCHPFFTGEMKFVDSLGRVEKFQQKQKHAQSMVQVLTDKKKKKKDREIARANAPKSLKEMLMGLK